MRIGIFLGNKQQSWLDAFQNEAKEYGKRTGLKVEVEAVDFERLEEQNLSLVLHKMCTHIALYNTDQRLRRELDLLANYFEKHPERAFDSLDAIKTINDRRAVSEVLQSFCVRTLEGRVVQPDFRVVTSREEALALKGHVPFALPWVCKPLVADGIPESHNLGLIVREEGLTEASYPYLIQPFLNHDAVIVKVYVLGDTLLQLRHSKENVELGVPVNDGPGFVPFGRVSNPNALPGDSKVRALPSEDIPLLPDNLLKSVVAELKKRLKVELFGVDLIRDSKTGDYVVIDVNYCPGYYGVSDVFHKLLDLFAKRLLD